MSIRPAIEAANNALALEIKRQQTIGHLRRTARDIAAELFDVQYETAETVALQNAFENSLNTYMRAMESAVEAIAYVAPEAARERVKTKQRSDLEAFTRGNVGVKVDGQPNIS